MTIWEALASDTATVVILTMYALMQVLGIGRSERTPIWWTTAVFLALLSAGVSLIMRLNGGAA